MPPVQSTLWYQRPPLLRAALLSSNRLANGFSAAQLCLPHLPRVITVEGLSAGLKRSVFFSSFVFGTQLLSLCDI